MTLRSSRIVAVLAAILGFAGLAPAQEPAKPGRPGRGPEARSEGQDREKSEAQGRAESGAEGGDKPGKPEDGASKPKADPAAKPEEDAKPRTEKATFGGGCFWCLEAVFERVPGVKSVVSGYSGGNVKRPSYEMVHTGTTGHAEVIQIVFDPEVVSYEDLLEVFWHCHDPTTLNRQGPDEGTQYRSIILYHNEDQKEAALASYRELTASRAFADPIVTQLVPFKVFYPAERYHQDYFRRNKNAPYCQAYIVPKIEKLRAMSRDKPKDTAKGQPKAR